LERQTWLCFANSTVWRDTAGTGCDTCVTSICQICDDDTHHRLGASQTQSGDIVTGMDFTEEARPHSAFNDWLRECLQGTWSRDREPEGAKRRAESGQEWRGHSGLEVCGLEIDSYVPLPYLEITSDTSPNYTPDSVSTSAIINGTAYVLLEGV
jgi:hypothetical protein